MIHRTVATFVAALCFATLSMEASAGSPQMAMPGAFAVSAAGAATYSIPIDVPPGTAGMVPSLSLNYSSQGGDGIVGFRWVLNYGVSSRAGSANQAVRSQGRQPANSNQQIAFQTDGTTASAQPSAGGTIGGTPQLPDLHAITRCPRTIAQDSVHGAVTFALTDRFCMDGQHLVVTSGSYGADSSQYRTEIESFVKVIAHGTTGNGPTWFEAHTRDGITLQFGNTTDSRLLAQGKSTVRMWSLNKAIDPQGNYLTVTYTNDTTNGQAYPTRIDYTGNAGASLSTYNSVQFTYIARTDQVPTYLAGSLLQNTVLLTHIKTYNGTTIVHDYQLAYSQATSGAMHDELTSVTLCDGSGNCLAPTSFGWQGSRATLTPTLVTTNSYGFPVDLNGDGITDYVLVGAPTSYCTPVGFPGMKTAIYSSGSFTLAELPYCVSGATPLGAGGFLGNGRNDLTKITWPVYPAQSPSTGVFFNDGAGNFPSSNGFTSTNGIGGVWTPFMAGDINGDGRSDLSDGKTVETSNGDQTFTATTLSSPGTLSVLSDFDGDGCADFGFLYGGPGASAGVQLSCNPAVASFGTTVPFSGSNIARFIVADFNGDGLSDILWLGQSTNGGSGSPLNSLLWLSTGTGWNKISLGYHIQANLTQYTDLPNCIGDFNGDGKTDVFVDGKVYLATGKGFLATSVPLNGVGGHCGTTGDWNQDGLAEEGGTSTTTGVSGYYSFGFVPEFVNVINNGIGQTINITYDRLNKNGTFYTKGTSATYPTEDVDGAMLVVSRVDASNGIGTCTSPSFSNCFSTTYAYAGAQTNVTGRGYLGFSQVAATNLQSGIVTSTNYRTDFPYIGYASSLTAVTTAASPNCSSGVTLKSVSNTPGSVNLGGTRNFVFTQSSTTTVTDCDGTAMPSVMTTTTNHYDCQDNPNPCYGELKSVAVSVGDGSSRTTTFSSFVDNTTNWCFDEPQTVTENRVVGSSNITRTTAYQYSSCLVSQESVEPGSSTLNVVSAYTVDAFGNRTATAISGSNFTSRTIHVGFDTKGEFATSTTDALSHVTNLGYDQRFGTMTSQIDPNNETTSWSFDTLGRPTQETRPDGTITKLTYAYCSGVNGGIATCPTYGAIQMQSEAFASNGTTQIGPTTTSDYDALSRAIAVDAQGFDGSTIRTATQFDAFGHPAQTSRPYFLSGGTPKWTVNSYDALDRVIQTNFPDGSQSSVDYDGLVIEATNACGQLTVTTRNAQVQVASVTDALDAGTSASTSCPSNPATAGDPGHHTTNYVYDAFNDLTQVTDPSGNVTTNGYDIRGHKLATSDPDMGSWSYVYDGLGELTSQTDAKSQTVNLVYDVEGRLSSRTEPDLTSTWTYGTTPASHNVDKLITATTNAGYQRAIAYDSVARPVTTTITNASTGYTYTTAYNATNGQIASAAYPSGLQINYGYTALGYLATLTDNATAKVYWTANTRDAELHLTQQTAGNSVGTTQTFDANTGRLTNVRAGTGNSVAQFDYTFDSAGNLTYRADDLQPQSEYFCYDPLNRLASYSAGNGITSCTATGYKTVTYDAIGDITAKSDIGTYTYPAAGQPRPHAVTSITGSVNGVSNPSYSYDANGNMSASMGRTVGVTTYNMVSSIVAGTNVLCLAYDSEHARITQAIGTGSCPSPTGPSTTTYLNDPTSGAMSEKLVSGSTTTWHDYIVSDEKIVAVRFCTGAAPCSSGATTRYFTLDHLGSVAVLTDDSGAVVERDSYDAWGKRRNSDGSDNALCTVTSQTTRGFTNQEEIDSQCLVNLNARIYDPAIARLMTPDDVVPDQFNLQAMNRFTYVDNGPLSYTDPTGHSFDPNFGPQLPAAAVEFAAQIRSEGGLAGLRGGAGALDSSESLDPGVGSELFGPVLTGNAVTVIGMEMSRSGGGNGAQFDDPDSFAPMLKARLRYLHSKNRTLSGNVSVRCGEGVDCQLAIGGLRKFNHRYSNGDAIEINFYPAPSRDMFPDLAILHGDALDRGDPDELGVAAFGGPIFLYDRWIQETVAHEFGHVLGFDHNLRDRNSVMWPYSNARNSFLKPEEAKPLIDEYDGY